MRGRMYLMHIAFGGRNGKYEDGRYRGDLDGFKGSLLTTSILDSRQLCDHRECVLDLVTTH